MVLFFIKFIKVRKDQFLLDSVEVSCSFRERCTSELNTLLSEITSLCFSTSSRSRFASELSASNLPVKSWSSPRSNTIIAARITITSIILSNVIIYQHNIRP